MATLDICSPIDDFQLQSQSSTISFHEGNRHTDQGFVHINVANMPFETPFSRVYQQGWAEHQEQPSSLFDHCATNENSADGENEIKQWRAAQMEQIPEPYRKVVVQYGKSGLPQINFHQYNRTGFCGLQDCWAEAYFNAMIQGLYFQETIRQLVLSHSCNVDSCLVCELSFLFHKMDQSPGFVCQSNNFQRTLRTNREALALALVVPESKAIPGPCMSAMVQAWNRFMLEQFDIAADRLSQQCQIQAVRVTKCFNCKGCISVECGNGNVSKLTYPTTRGKIHFEDVLATSLSGFGTKPSWCGLCRHFQTANRRRQIQLLPASLTVNTGLDQGINLQFWRDQCAQLASDSDHSDQSWIPERFSLRRFANGKLKGGMSELSTVEREELLEEIEYELHSVCSTVVDPDTEQALNVVTTINVGAFYHARVGSPVSQWYLFNDFSIDPINISEARRINLKWKIPSSLVYRRVNSVLPNLKNAAQSAHCPFDFEEFSSIWSQASPLTFLPLETSEIPSAGDLVALDADFVTLKPEKKALGEDSRIVEPAQRAVARVTCLRGQGPMTGVPFVDDYISCEEEIFDHVTEYSGIYPGDLDPMTSSKYLTSMKCTYKKIRCLVDVGCIFVGHGLKSDFEMLNIVVPTEQVVDTVHLFRLPHKRMLSLKFLA